MIETSSDLLRQSSAMFGNIRIVFGKFGKCSENVRLALTTIFENLRKSLENRQKVCLYDKENITCPLLVLNSISHSFAAFTREMLNIRR